MWCCVIALLYITIRSIVLVRSFIRTFLTEKTICFLRNRILRRVHILTKKQTEFDDREVVIFSTRMSRAPTRRKQSKALSSPRSRTFPRVVETSPVRFEQHFLNSTDSSNIDTTIYAGPKTAPHPSNVPLPPAHWLNTFSQPINDLTVMTLHLRQILKVPA